MLTCIARAKQGSDGSPSTVDHHHNNHHRPGAEKLNSNGVPTKQSIKTLSSQVIQMFAFLKLLDSIRTWVSWNVEFSPL